MVSFRALPLLALLSAICAAQSTTSAVDTTPTTAPSGVQPGAGSHGYTYAGCYNETLDIPSVAVRALAGGEMETNVTATTATCLAFCAGSGAQFAGLEYGQECWCAPYLNSYSAKLNESACNLECMGNASEICGGRLTLTLYNLTGSTSGAARGLGAGSGGLVYAVAGVGVVSFALGLL